MDIHWKSKLRAVHSKVISKDAKKGERGDVYELWEQINTANIPLWYLQLLGDPDKEGSMIKKGGIGGALTKRWFVLAGPLLFYFSNEQSEARAKGVVLLLDSEIVKHEVQEKEAQKYAKKAAKGGLKLGYCWAVKTKVREFVISCESEGDREDWMAACQRNTAIQLSDNPNGDPKTSMTYLRKLLGTPDQVRKDIDNLKSRKLPSQPAAAAATDTTPPTSTPENAKGDAGGAKGGVPPVPARGGGETPLPPEVTSGSSAASADASAKSDNFFDGYTGGTANGWKYEADGVVKTFDVKTDGSWPFVDDEPGLYINCKYSWNGSKMRAREGSGSKGEWDGTAFKWSCFPLGDFFALYSYEWVAEEQKFVAIENAISDVELPEWQWDGTTLRNASGSEEQFPSVNVDGSIPPPIVLAVAMHSWQWKMEGELTLEMQHDE